MPEEPDLTPVLEDLAAGRIDAAEAARRIDLLKGAAERAAEPSDEDLAARAVDEEPPAGVFNQPPFVDEVPPSSRRASGARGVDRVSVVGGGRVTRRRALLIEEHGVAIERWLEVDPDKIGQTASGRPVCSWHDLGAPGREFLLSYVGNRGAGARIARELSQRGWRPGTHFLLAA